MNVCKKISQRSVKNVFGSEFDLVVNFLYSYNTCWFILK